MRGGESVTVIGRIEADKSGSGGAAMQVIGYLLRVGWILEAKMTGSCESDLRLSL
jgi:hypothetical protein